MSITIAPHIMPTIEPMLRALMEAQERAWMRAQRRAAREAKREAHFANRNHTREMLRRQRQMQQGRLRIENGLEAVAYTDPGDVYFMDQGLTAQKLQAGSIDASKIKSSQVFGPTGRLILPGRN